MQDRPVIGISYFLHKDPMPIWVNGAAMNNLFLIALFKAAGYDVRVLNAGDGTNIGPAMMLAQAGFEINFIPIEEGLDEVDVLIECGAQISAEHERRVHHNGGRVVGYRFGNSYVLDGQRAVSGQRSGSIFNGTQFDAVWTNAQHMHTCASYWETCYRAPVVCLPHIWEPWFIDAAIAEFPTDLRWGYRPGRSPKNVAVFEPNIDVVKMAYYPILACEETYRKRPDLVGDVYVTNALSIKEQLSFKHFALNLDIYRAGKLSFEGRFNTPWFMARYGDICVTHQWENALNYLYYDILYGGYPLVHNSPLLPDGIGYRYQEFDAQEAGRVLTRVMSDHDGQATEYKQRAEAFLKTVRATAPANIEAHELALRHLLERPAIRSRPEPIAPPSPPVSARARPPEWPKNFRQGLIPPDVS